MRGSREISLAPSLHRASTDALIITHPLPRGMAVCDYSEASTTAVLHVEICNISEGDETIIETPVTSVPPAIAIVVENN